ncbi:MAG: 50S ribosomal protein L25 [Ruminobacter sp.]|mgnify:CR=1 FL=1|jgi:large subunit ribosomal protein L25|uniref:50S ribosomal protein L25 n=1 Tax=Ruminobacter sp. TaxID=2774296 RepID=UPI001AFE53BB|nr:50S ribosomal protein L25 [Ruminobacter sp.]MBO6010111.1 50S ribosomal protein L25 [Ruminobacter sp.]MBP3748913.1 50S ribosomal protein L25 [Ruminobacter sp.]
MAYKFDAQIRNDFGKGASRRLRRSNLLPVIVYGGDKEPVALSLDNAKLFTAQQNKSFYEESIVLAVAGGEEIAVKPVAIQRHPVNGTLIHIDFMRV